jgi:hypothetical protein
MKKFARVLGLLTLCSLSSCVFAIGVPADEWSDSDEFVCPSCHAAPVCAECQKMAAQHGGK